MSTLLDQPGPLTSVSQNPTFNSRTWKTNHRLLSRSRRRSPPRQCEVVFNRTTGRLVVLFACYPKMCGESSPGSWRGGVLPESISNRHALAKAEVLSEWGTVERRERSLCSCAFNAGPSTVRIWPPLRCVPLSGSELPTARPFNSTTIPFPTSSAKRKPEAVQDRNTLRIEKRMRVVTIGGRGG